MSDLIGREDAIALLTKIVFDEPPYFDSETLCRLYAEEQINKLPSADRPTGRWVNNTNGTYTCDRCGCTHSRSKYCPNCGAKMKGG